MLRTGLQLPHELSPEDILIESITASGIVSILKEINHDTELMFYHHVFFQLGVRMEAMGWTGLDADTPGHPAAAMSDLLIDEIVESDISKFYRDCAQLYHCLSRKGILAKLEPLWQSLQSGEPLNATDADDVLVKQVVNNSALYHTLVQQNNRAEYKRITAEHAQEGVKDRLTESELEEYICSSIMPVPGDTDIDLEEFEDGFVQCMCEFCRPRLHMWSQVREEGIVPDRSELQSMIVELMEVDLREADEMSSESNETDDLDLDTEEEMWTTSEDELHINM